MPRRFLSPDLARCPTLLGDVIGKLGDKVNGNIYQATNDHQAAQIHFHFLPLPGQYLRWARSSIRAWLIFAGENPDFGLRKSEVASEMDLISQPLGRCGYWQVISSPESN
jgi:hypothetical protein